MNKPCVYVGAQALSIFLWHQHLSGSEENSSPDDGEDEVTDEQSVDEDEDSSPLATSTVFRQSMSWRNLPGSKKARKRER